MASKSNKSENARSNSISITDGAMGAAVLAAWRGIYHLFGGRADFAVTPNGVTVENFSVDAAYDPEQIAQDVSHRNRRLDFATVFPWTQGEVPEPFTDSKQITQWSVQFLRGSMEENSSRTPKYYRDAAANYKTVSGFAKKRGPQRKIFRAENLSEIDENTLSSLTVEDLAKLKETVEASLRQHTAENTPAPEPELATA